MPGVLAHEEKIYAFSGRNQFEDEIIRRGLHSRGIFCVPGGDIVELDVVRRPVVCPRLLVQPEHVTPVLSCGACGGHQEILSTSTSWSCSWNWGHMDILQSSDQHGLNIPKIHAV